MRAFNDTQLNKRSFRVSAGVTLRECSVVIIGSTCKICGRNFKCESDVSLHSQWRHGTIGSLIMQDTLHHEIYLESIGQKCDICDVQFHTISDLKIHKRLIHKHGTRSKYRKRPGKETVRVKFKLNGMTTMDVNLNRKYLKMENCLRYFVDAGTQTTDSLEIEKHPDNCGADIDLFLSDYVVNNSYMQHVRPHKAANRYIVGKFTSTKGDATVRFAVGGRSLLEISNTSNRDVIPDNRGSYKEYENHRSFTFQENTADTWIRSFFNNLDIYNKENSQGKLNEPERKNAYCQVESLSNDNKGLIYQRDKFDKTTSVMSKQLSTKEIRYDPMKQPYEATGDKRSAKRNAKLTKSLADFEEIIIDNENNKIDETVTKHSHASLIQNSFNKKNELIKDNLNDDDIQEVLRITRKNIQSDINHESPNRFEREILVQNTGNETLRFPTRQEPTVCPEKCNARFAANFKPSSYSAFRTVTESSYQFLANAFDKRLGIYLEDMHHYGINYYNEQAEINNNNIEEYAIYAHQGFFEPRMQIEEP
ncbi:uncharacterized protein LOC126852988 [Cataglyphis hispanica]|uniref:uncharacterized protein LOC126852988 n=1 Tax=Cataglyphis hispanica TaxID=1086592 RepID=UPI0021808F7E|nr:uncharacterized protein LOC126852988 [Cataglyphis hispanica]